GAGAERAAGCRCGDPRQRPGRSPRARRRALGGASGGPWNRDARRGGRVGRPRTAGAEALAALGAAAGEDLAAVGGRHAGTEAVVALALEVAGLEGALGGHGVGSSAVTQRKEPAILGCQDPPGQSPPSPALP